MEERRDRLLGRKHSTNEFPQQKKRDIFFCPHYLVLLVLGLPIFHPPHHTDKTLLCLKRSYNTAPHTIHNCRKKRATYTPMSVQDVQKHEKLQSCKTQLQFCVHPHPTTHHPNSGRASTDRTRRPETLRRSPGWAPGALGGLGQPRWAVVRRGGASPAVGPARQQPRCPLAGRGWPEVGHRRPAGPGQARSQVPPRGA